LLVVFFEHFGWTKDYCFTITLPQALVYLRALRKNNAMPIEPKGKDLTEMPAEQFTTINYVASQEEWEKLKNGNG
jgi:hypothetical protein